MGEHGATGNRLCVYGRSDTLRGTAVVPATREQDSQYLGSGAEEAASVGGDLSDVVSRFYRSTLETIGPTHRVIAYKPSQYLGSGAEAASVGGDLSDTKGQASTPSLPHFWVLLLPLRLVLAAW